MRAVLVVVALCAMEVSASAGTITGRITAQVGGAGIASAEVRMWSLGTKGWFISQTTTADGNGNYSFTATGDRLIDARGPAGSAANWGDRWYDSLAPNSSGYVGESADVITVGASETEANKNIALEVLGGADGVVVRTGGIAAPDMWVRMERNFDFRIHHNDFTNAPSGLVSMRGMVPATDYQIIVYDPAGVRNTLLRPAVYSITSNQNGDLGTLTMSDPPADPYENNNSANCSTVSISGTMLHADPPQQWTSTNARIGPLSAQDVDWFCYTANEGDRLFVTATTAFSFGGTTRRHPWTDPLLSFWRGPATTKLVENDDFAGMGFDARVDTGPLTAGCHCAAVTMFGDSDFNGSGQTSTGNYQLVVTMGNRPPVPSIKKGALEVPASPATFSIDEGDTLVLDLSYIDADHQIPTKSFTHRDNTNAAVADGTLVLNAETGSYTWTAPPDAADRSPYTLALQAGDAEFTMTKTVILVVNTVNMPPETPVLIAPIENAVVDNGAPPLMWMASDDPDGDTVDYDVELYADDPGGAPAQTAGGLAATTWTPTTIAENTRVWWRVRAGDPGGGLSPWSDYGTFLVDSANDPPGDPILLKPSVDEIVVMRRPGLSVLDVEDPEDDGIEYVFEIADDADFNSVIWTSDPIPDNPVSGTTMTSVDTDLAWGHNYWARVMAQDVRGGISNWSDAHHFVLKDNVPPSTPGFDGGCVDQTYTEAPPDRFIVTNVEDVEGELVTMELRIFRFEDDPSSDNPVYQTQELMDTTDTVTVIPVDLADLPNGHYRYFVRATDGSDFSDAAECEFTLDIVEEPPATPDGGCCDAGDPAGTTLLVLLTLGVLWLRTCAPRSSLSSVSPPARRRRGRAPRA